MATTEQIEWLEVFLGMKPETVDPSGGKGTKGLDQCVQESLIADIRLKEKQRIVIESWKKIDVVKANLQTNFSQIKQKGGMRALEIKGTQLDELDFTEIKMAEIPKEIRAPLLTATNALINIVDAAKDSKVTVQGETVDVFTNREMMDEFWTPLKRERIIPETFIGDKVSETQVMLDETNKLYLEAVARHKEAGTLTAKVDLVSELLGGGSDLASGMSSILGEFTGADLALATDILDTMSTVLKEGAELRTKLKSKDIGGGVSKAFSVMGTITQAALGAAGVDPAITKVVGGAFNGAGIAAEFGQRVADGNPDGALDLFGQLVQSTLTTAAQGVAGDKQAADALKIAASLAPAAIGKIRDGKEFAEKVMAGTLKPSDLIELGAKLMKDVLANVETIVPGSVPNNEEIEKYTDMAAGAMKIGADALYKLITESEGNFVETLDAMLEDVGNNLEDVLKAAKVPDSKVDEIVSIFEGLATGPRMVKFLTQNPPDILGMVSAAGVGIEKSFNLASGGDSNIQMAGKTLAQSLAASADLAPVFESIKNGNANFPEVFKALCTSMGKPLGAISEDVGEALTELGDAMDANDLLAEADNDVSEEALANPNGLDNLIAKVAMDKMVLNLGMQIAQGGVAFLAKFVPGLGAASAAIKLAAELMAAGKRASQLAQWMAGADDLSKAQSELLSSALNFVNNQADQLAYHGAQALCAATLLAGEIAKLAGPAAPIGAAMAGTASGASKLIDVIHEKKIKVEVELAWNKTAKALRNPANRRLGLEARKLNPSLAKYAIAWGAMVLKDPLAANVLRAAGLNQANLADPNADTHKLVKYLETYYDEDPTLYRDVDENPEWMPGDVELTAQFWRRTRKNALEKGKLVINDSQAIEGWLSCLDSVERQIDQLDGVVNTARVNFETAKKNMPPPTPPSGGTGGQTEKPSERRKRVRNTPVPIPLAEAQALKDALALHLVKIEEKSQALQRTADLLNNYVPCAKPEESDSQRDGKLAMLRVVSIMKAQARKAANAIRTEEADAKGAVGALELAISGSA
jgi:hypothetical protein